MIYIVMDDVFSIDVNVLVIPVSCDGLMSKHLVNRFRNRYNSNYINYQRLCFNKEMEMGSIIATKATPNRKKYNNISWIIKFPISISWGGKCKYEDIEKGLNSLKLWILENEIQSIAIPPLGCGSGKLDFEKVKLLIYRYLISLKETNIYLCLPRSMRKFIYAS